MNPFDSVDCELAPLATGLTSREKEFQSFLFGCQLVIPVVAAMATPVPLPDVN
jgi:hypothetical protein